MFSYKSQRREHDVTSGLEKLVGLRKKSPEDKIVRIRAGAVKHGAPRCTKSFELAVCCRTSCREEVRVLFTCKLRGEARGGVGEIVSPAWPKTTLA